MRNIAKRKSLAGRLGAALLGLGLCAGPAAAADGNLPRLHTNQQFVEDATLQSGLAIKDPLAVFAFVLGSLPERVTVYPTENYFYFSFYHDGTRYAGNIRLDASNRDQSKVHFAYYEDLTEWKGEEAVAHVLLDASHGVKVEKAGDLVYKVSHRDKTVTFALNDLSHVRPPANAVAADERFIGPVFDESGIRFFLLYNRTLKIFHYVLDETIKPADVLLPGQTSDRILIGKRTGFAFYRDHKLDRKILIGVFEGNSSVNNYFDGPFDQLPDNFIKGEELREAILEVEPALAGKIDRFGGSADGSDRFLISPYTHYRSEADLQVFDDCATSKAVPAALYHACFVIEHRQEAAAEPPPAAAKRKPKGKKTARAGKAAVR